MKKLLLLLLCVPLIGFGQKDSTQVWLTVEYTDLEWNEITEDFDVTSISTSTRLYNIEDTFNIEIEDQSGGGIIIELDTVRVNEIKQSMNWINNQNIPFEIPDEIFIEEVVVEEEKKMGCISGDCKNGYGTYNYEEHFHF